MLSLLPGLSKKTGKRTYRSVGHVIDICDSIVSVSAMSDAFSGELVRFKKRNGAISGFV